MPDRHSEENRLRAILVAMLPSGIPADKIADGSVSNAEFQSLNGAPPNIALSLSQKQPISALLSSIAAAPSDGVLVKDGSSAEARALAAPVIATDYCAIDLGGADDQYLVVFGVNAFNYLSDDPANARRAPWPSGHLNIGLIEVNPTTAVGADEDFKVEPWGCIYGYSGALQSAALSALDNVATARLTFNSGDTAAKRFLGNFPAVIGGLPLTHVALRISRLGISNYPGQLRIDVQARP